MNGSWSKYGGGRKVIRKLSFRGWMCQVCGKEHDPEEESNLAELLQGEQFRVCGSCVSGTIYYERIRVDTWLQT